MGKVTCDMAMSVDGFVAGPNQRADAPFGDGVGESLHGWMFDEPEHNAAELAAIIDAGAFIMGRNMFGPGRGAWDLDWTGWWGDEPPYHAPVFVLTHHERRAGGDGGRHRVPLRDRRHHRGARAGAGRGG